MKPSFILRMKNNDSEGDKYDYYKSQGRGCDIITPFKDEAKIFAKTSEVKVYTKGWEFIKLQTIKRHKWGEVKRPFSQKMQVCEKCGIERYWLGGDMQCWEYLDLQSVIDSKRTTLNRPECEPDRGQTHGFYRDGKYIYNKKTKTMKNEIKVGDRVQLNEHPKIKSRVVEIGLSTFTNVNIYYLRNGCQVQKNEMTKVKS